MTKIEWTQRPGTKGETWNPIRAQNKATGGTGHFCTKVSAGCQNCYAADFQKRFKNPVRYAAQDADQVELFLDETVLMQPLRWKKPRTIFVCSMTDLFYEGHPIEWIWDVWAVMALAPQHTFIVLTKRVSYANTALVNRLRMGDPAICKAINQIPAFLGNRKGALEMPLPNVWIGTSVEDQATADHRIPHLLNTPAAVRFLSAEPLLGPVNLSSHSVPGMCGTTDRADYLRGYVDPEYSCRAHLSKETASLDWVIVGGESGHKARPMHPDWARALRDQCKAAGVPFFFKQWGAWAPGLTDDTGFIAHSERYRDDGTDMIDRLDQSKTYETTAKVGKKRAGRLLDGIEHNAFPEVSPCK